MDWQTNYDVAHYSGPGTVFGLACKKWVTQMIKAAYNMRWTLLSAVFFGWLMAPSSHTISSAIWHWYDTRNPVVQFQGEIVRRDNEKIIIHIWGHKLRDCVAVTGSVNSYSVKDGVLYGAHEQRMSGDSSSRPVGPVDMGTWLVWPNQEGAQEILMTVRHDCDGRIITTETVRVKL